MNAIKTFFLAVDLIMEVFASNIADYPSLVCINPQNSAGTISGICLLEYGKSSCLCEGINLQDVLEESDEKNIPEVPGSTHNPFFTNSTSTSSLNRCT